jgi:triosephosphate isomerase
MTLDFGGKARDSLPLSKRLGLILTGHGPYRDFFYFWATINDQSIFIMQTQRAQIVAGNWKMNKSYTEGRDLANGIMDKLQPTEAQVILATPYIHLKNVANIISGVSNIYLSAQNLHQEDAGAYTGEISASMLRSVGATHTLIGHSERRAYFNETNEILAQKVDQALVHGLTPIFCCGEVLDIREAGNHLEEVEKQIVEGTFHLEAEQWSNIILAYEPVWAIGTGKTASPDQAQEMHAHIRSVLSKKYGQTVADSVSILYGGSVKPANALELFSQPDVDGGLVGGASLKAEDFVAIVKAMNETMR